MTARVEYVLIGGPAAGRIVALDTDVYRVALVPSVAASSWLAAGPALQESVNIPAVDYRVNRMYAGNHTYYRVATPGAGLPATLTVALALLSLPGPDLDRVRVVR